MRPVRPFRALVFVAGLTVGLFAALPARADVSHVVGRGETLFWIAKKYRTTPEAIRSANGLREKQLIHPGLSLTIPGVVKPGKDAEPKPGGKEKDRDADKGKGAAKGKGTEKENERDAKAGKGKGAKDAKAGKDARDANAKGGKDAKNAKDAKGKGKDSKKAEPSYAARPKKPGFVTMLRGTEKLEAQVLARGQLNRATLPGLTKILRHVASDSKKSVDPRLAYLIGLVSDHFGGKKIHVVSGYRPFSKKQYTPHSNHNLGRAMDFSIEGVPNTVVRDYCRTLADAGVGYYPNSTFVHLDVRTGKAYWVDYSGPGEAPRYDARAKHKADEATRDVEGNDESGSAETQPATPQPSTVTGGNPGSADAPAPRPKSPGLKTPTPAKGDSPTAPPGVSDDPY